MVLVFSVILGGMGNKDVFTGTSELGCSMPNFVQRLFLSLRLGNVHLGETRHFENA